MAQVKHIVTAQVKRVEIFVTAEELLKVLQHQDLNVFSGIRERDFTYTEYCLTFDEE